MQYNFHIEKYKMSDIGGIKKEQFRQYKDVSKYRNHVDPSRSDRNSYIDMVEDGCDWFKHIREAKQRTTESTGRAVRKDAVVLCSTVESVPKSWDADACREYFQSKAEWFGEYLHKHGSAGEDCLKSLVIHMDESTPHATYVWIPERDGRLQAKNILTREFLTALQRDGQQFTISWIDDWNRRYPDRQIEQLSPYVLDSGRQHLAEAEYKEMKVEEHVESMKESFEKTRQEIGDLTWEKEQLDVSIQQATEARERYEEKLIQVTQAPDIPTYAQVIQENKTMKEELSVKDRLIERLQSERDRLRETAEQWKATATEWKERFYDITHKAGEKMMSFFGYDVTGETAVPEYPVRTITEGLSQIQAELNGMDPQKLRILPDNDNPGTFRVASKDTSGSFETVRSGFESRTSAEDWRRNVTESAKILTRHTDEKMTAKLSH